MITTPASTCNIRNENLIAVFYDKAAIDALAVQLVASQVEGAIDMMSDMPVEYTNFKDISDCIAGAKESANDYVEDLIAEFRERLEQSLLRVKVSTKEVILRGDDDIDANVEITIV
jgi:(p)ppGpp synthase/HD superfamily hydrolase